jgi:hypothetical protein
MPGEDGQEALVRGPLVEEKGPLQLGRQLQLRFEGRLLRGAGREVAVEVEPALADGADFRRPRERRELAQRLRRRRGRVVRVDARGSRRGRRASRARARSPPGSKARSSR